MTILLAIFDFFLEDVSVPGFVYVLLIGLEIIKDSGCDCEEVYE